MAQARDITTVDETAWTEAVAREFVLRRLAGQERLNRAEVVRACRELGVRRARLYQLLRAYRTRPVWSSVVDRRSGSRAGSRRLSAAVEALIDEAIQTCYRTRQKPSVNALHKEVRRLCWQKSVRAPNWHAVRSRVKSIDPKDLVADREGAKAARDRFRPVPGRYIADHAFEVVQIDHTKVDLIVVDSMNRTAIQRPWLTLAIDVASRVVAGFYLTLEAPSSLSDGVTARIFRLIETAAETAIRSGRERLDLASFSDDDLIPPLVSMTQAAERRAGRARSYAARR